MDFADSAPNWYASLKKPFFAPPSWIFGPVWTVLYIMIGIAFFRSLKLWRQDQFHLQFIAIFIINLIANLAFSPIQFGLQSNLLALLDILIVLASLAYLVIKSHNQDNLVFYLLLPYLLWVAFATILQISVTILNF